MKRKYSRFINVLLSVAILLTSCNLQKKYYYKEGKKPEKIIIATSDSAAYLEAFKSFVITKKVYDDMKKTLSSPSQETPIAFELLNEKHEDITYKITFVNKDSLEKAIENKINELPNSIEASMNRVTEEKIGIGAKYDTAGLYLAPVKVLKAKFVTKEYSNYKDISLSYKNISDKKIAGIKFKWYGINAFNEPADMGGLLRGWGSGFADDGLKPGRTDSGTWGILSKDGKKILIAYPYEVAYEDGTKWELK